MSQRATVIQALGLRTFLNELTAGDGALKLAENVNIDEKGVITQRRGFNDYGSALTLTADRCKQIFEYKNRILRHFDTKIQFDNGSGTFNSFDGSYSELESGLRIKYQEASGNMFFTTSNGIKKISATNASSFTTASGYILKSGAVKAIDLSAALLPTTDGYLPAQSKSAYRILFGYKDANNNLLLGTPSSRYVLTNTSETVNTYEKSTITVSAYASIVAREYILLSGKDINYVLWFKKNTTDTEPLAADTLGKTFIEIDIIGLASNNDVAAKIAYSITQNNTNFTTSLLSNVVTITSTEGANTTDISEGGSGVTGVTVATTLNGQVSEGTPANAQLTFTLPQDISNVYFYRIYRTNVTSLVAGLTLNDLDPGDEMRLVYEESVTDTDIANGYITVDDITPETFRNNGENLYINPITGEGINQSNDVPPIAKDIELFRNSMFYSNTKTTHKLQFNLLSVTDFVSGSSKFIIGNSDTTLSYTFVGTAENTTITVGSYANTLQTNANNSYILINSANNERKYYIWFNKGSGVDPLISNRIGIMVNLSDLSGASSPIVAQRIYDTLLDISDFNVSILSNVLDITNVNNGDTTNTTSGTGVPTTDIGATWAISTSTAGTGQNAASRQVLLSGLASVAQAIEETARSLIYVINQDSSSPVIATYLSSANDLPGIILFENVSLEDKPFYLAVNQYAITQKFNPTLTNTKSISTVTFSSGSGSPAKILSTAHGLTTGTEVFVYSPNTTPAISGKYTATVINANSYTIPVNITAQDLAGTNALWFIPSTAVSDNLTSPNRIYYSKTNQPEAVPILNYIDVGTKDQEIERIIALRDNLFILKTDGVYILSGSTAPNFSVRLLDNSTSIIAPDSAAVLNNQIYCLTTQGIITVTETGVSIISRDIENLILDVANNKFDYRYTSFGVSYENDRSYMLWLPSLKTDSVATQCYRFNTFERTWTKWTITATCGKVNSNDDKLYLGAGDRNYIYQERKNNDRTDFSDRQFDLTIGSNSVNDKVTRISSSSEVEIGDVIYQEQYITIARFNRLLRKLDLDNGLHDSDYESSLKMSYGDNITNSLNLLNAKLVADDSSGIVTSVSFSTTGSVLQTQFNTMMGQLNNVACDTSLKNYKTFSDTVPYESIITSIDFNRNEVTQAYAIPLVEGDVTIFKGIKAKIQWQPMHFGDPSGLKQIAESSIMFDQNNFYSATISFSSDLSQSFSDVPFLSKGVGYWGYGEFGGQNYYWGGDGNDAPFRTIVPLQKQRCRYLTMKYSHMNAREKWRILGVSSVVRAISSRAYR